MRLRARALGLFLPLVTGCTIDASGIAADDDLVVAARDTGARDTTFIDTELPDTNLPDTELADTTVEDTTDTAVDTFVADTFDAAPETPVPAAVSCKQLHTLAPSLPSGVYSLSADAGSYSVYCDMVTDLGGWTLVLAYNHAAATNPARVPGTRPTNPNTGFSHFDNAQMLSLATFDTVRMFCSTSGHTRQLHFKTSNANVVSYIGGVAGAMNTDAMWKTGFTPLTGHTAGLPAATDSSPASPFSPAVDLRMTEYPFFKYAALHFSIGGQGSRWECDDWASYNNTTLHQVWVR